MVFSSTIFVFLFLPLVLLCYYLAPSKIKNYVLLLFSIIFYIFGGPKFLLILIITVLIDYFGAILIAKTNKKKLFLTLTITINLLILIYFKYMGFFIENINNIFNSTINIKKIIMPIGISFYTFQSMSYVIDVYRKEVSYQKNFFNLLLYVSLFPQLVAGPIVRYKQIENEINKKRHPDLEYGIRRFILGLGKKTIIANQMGSLADIIFSTQNLTTPVAWVGAIAYTFQIYFDFSAYSDMAIGMGKMFGFNFKENFNFPYISKSITEFWRRWHISLSTWFKDYVYIPLGGNKKGIKRQIFNLLIVWILTGFWHGAEWNFLIWGLYYFIFLILEKFILKNVLEKTPNIINHIYTLIIVVIGWVIFRCDNLDTLKNLGKALFTFNVTSQGLNELSIYLETYFVYLILAIIFSMPVYYIIIDKIKKIKNKKLKLSLDILHYTSLLLVFIISIMFLAKSSYNPFIYFRF